MLVALWRGRCRDETCLEACAGSVYFFPLNSTLCGHFTVDDYAGFGIRKLVLRISVKFWIVFSVGMRGHAELWRLGSDDLGDLYICIHGMFI